MYVCMFCICMSSCILLTKNFRSNSQICYYMKKLKKKIDFKGFGILCTYTYSIKKVSYLQKKTLLQKFKTYSQKN